MQANRTLQAENAPCQEDALIFDLYPVTIHGQRARTLKEAAYLIRQYAIDHNDLWGWKLTRVLRNAESSSDIERAEDELQAWLRTKQAQPQYRAKIVALNGNAHSDRSTLSGSRGRRS